MKKAVGKLPSFLLEHVTGIGPAYSAWEANVLPLNYTCEYLYYI